MDSVVSPEVTMLTSLQRSSLGSPGISTIRQRMGRSYVAEKIMEDKQPGLIMSAAGSRCSAKVCYLMGTWNSPTF